MSTKTERTYCGTCWETGMTERLYYRWLDLKYAVARWFAQPAPKDVDDSDIPF